LLIAHRSLPRTIAAMAYYNPVRPAYIEDPYPSLAQLRRQEPVHHSPDLNGWVLTTYELCDRVLHDDAAFSSDPVHARGGMGDSVAAKRAAAPLGSAPILGNSDPPDHTRLRAIVNRAFVPRAMDATRPAIEALAARLLEPVGDDGLEVMSGLSEQLVIGSVLHHLGIPEADRPLFRECGSAIMRARAEGAEAIPAAEVAYQRLEAMLERWQTEESPEPGSVLGTLIEAAKAGERITAGEMLMLLIHISLAGNGPTAYAIGNAVLHLAQNPEALSTLAADRGAIPAAVEELLRFDSATHVVARFATAETKLGARTIRPGETCFAVIGAANRDPARFAEPDTLDIERADNRHLSFGMASHFCLGAPLARMEMAIAINALLDRYGVFRLKSMQRGGTFLLRGPAKVTISKG